MHYSSIWWKRNIQIQRTSKKLTPTQSVPTEVTTAITQNRLSSYNKHINHQFEKQNTITKQYRIQFECRGCTISILSHYSQYWQTITYLHTIYIFKNSDSFLIELPDIDFLWNYWSHFTWKNFIQFSLFSFKMTTLNAD